MEEQRKPNRLANEKSPYLLKHAYNPFDWYGKPLLSYHIHGSEDSRCLVDLGLVEERLGKQEENSLKDTAVSESMMSSIFRRRVTQPQKFSGSEREKTYLIYFAAGDLRVFWHGRHVRVEAGTTHPAQLELVSYLFDRYASPIVYPARRYEGYYWRVVYHLHRSFGFLITEAQEFRSHISGDDPLFYSALAGFTDAEGHIGLRDMAGKAYGILTLSNRNKTILNDFQLGLRNRGTNSRLYKLMAMNGKIQWQLEAHGSHALRILPLLNLLHREKKLARSIVLKYNGERWSLAGEIYKSFRERVRSERNNCVQAASEVYRHRERRKQLKSAAYGGRISLAHSLKVDGLTTAEIANSLDCSLRTVYRMLRRHKLAHG